MTDQTPDREPGESAGDLTALPPSSMARPAPPPKRFADRVRQWVLVVLATAFWCHLVLLVLFFDVDTWLVRHLAPGQDWLITYRWLVQFVALALVVLMLRGKRLFGWLLFVGGFPLIVTFFYVPRALIKRKAWTLAVALTSAAVSAFRSLRWTLTFWSAIFVGSLLVLVSLRQGYIVAGAVLLLLAVAFAYVRTALRAFRGQEGLFSSRALHAVWSTIRGVLSAHRDLTDVDPDKMTEEQRDKWVSDLETTILYCRGSAFIASKLRELKQKRLGAITSALSVLGLFGLTVWVFGLVNFTLYRADPGAFAFGPHTPSKFDFIWYSFNSMFRAAVMQIEPVSVTARVLGMLATLLVAVILFVIILFWLSVVKEARESEEISGALAALRDQARVSAEFIEQTYGMPVDQAIQYVLRVKVGSAAMQWAAKFSWDPALDRKREAPDR